MIPVTLVLTIMSHGLFLHPSSASKLDYALVTLQDYCDGYAENMKPLICVIKDNKFVTANPNATTTTYAPHSAGWGWGWTESWRRRPYPRPPRPPPPPSNGWGWHQPFTEGWHESSESEEATDCSCDLKCVPRLLPINNDTITNGTFQCKQCGSDCDVKTVLEPTCTCLGFSGVTPSVAAVGRKIDTGSRIGRQGGMTLPCNCTVTCARRDREDRKFWDWGHHHPEKVDHHHHFHHHVDNDGWPFCIFSVSGLQRSNPLSLRAMTCECCKSQATAENRIPDFVCICQPS